MKYFLPLFICFFAFFEAKSDTCNEFIPEIESQFKDLNIKAVNGFLSSQTKIDFDKNGLDRFYTQSLVTLIEAERVPFTKEKQIHSLSPSHKKLLGFHIAAKTHKSYHNGIEIFDWNLMDSDENEAHNFMPASPDKAVFKYLKDFESTLVPLTHDYLEGDNLLLSHGTSARWSQHSFIFQKALDFERGMTTQLFFETDFKYAEENSTLENIGEWFHNSGSGSRIDTCIYFLFESFYELL